MPISSPRAFLALLFHAAVAAADPLTGLRAHLPARPKGKVVVIGAGKGAAQMARALETIWDSPLEGVVVTRYGYGCETHNIEIIEASHPVPDAAGLAASGRLFAAIKDLTSTDLVIALICGGGSALLPSPPSGLTLEDEIALNETLLASGAPISAMNVLRKHLSTVKGGRLAAATKARVVSLIVSDIPGDNPAHVASGPTVPDASTRHDALEIVRQYGLELPQAALDHLNSSKADAPLPDDPAFARNEHYIIASAGVSLQAAAELARSHGIEAAILSDSIEGESRDVALVHAAIAKEVLGRDRPFAKPIVILSGGETTVTLRAKGGRRSLSSECAAMRVGRGGASGAGWSAPPYTRRQRPARAKPRRSRRTVSSETPRLRASSGARTLPSFQRRSRILACRSCKRRESFCTRCPARSCLISQS